MRIQLIRAKQAKPYSVDLYLNLYKYKPGCTMLSKAKPNRKLTFLYLANDVIQNSKRKGPEFTKDFAPVIVEAFKHVSSESDESCKKHLGRVLSIWEERSVYENDVLEQLRQALYGDRKVRKRTYEQIKVDENNCSPRSSPTDPPQTTDLIRALQELENAASGDAAVHQRIASLPIEVQDVSLLDRITDKESGEQLSKMVDDACMLLADYNGRLAAEIDDRKQLTRMLSDFLRCQKEFLAEKEHKLEVVDMDLSSNDVTSISTHILLKINLRIKILYCLLFLKTEEEEFCNYSYQTSAIFIYILTNVTEFMPEMDKYLSTVIPLS
ncbi:PREDICTED: LOW QUALITY PROTEIN: regulation of nuclear pre-mRNA domain-containing protein 1A [Aptenodytes forsteri]|uniref:LOW QUALITY PROTEIN: regulation of nuclear pre-mRNA domain-containing protein 1A n=1 Tax=Aptenodytes forsteri TaxID=9233 RepID=UPI00090599FA|nr:PREDICTED: LOW QUALITY PROTEIN: regulation of nuclear pre-mRNA domain-containing protein 1A [Aptenodytes forsteri]